MKTEAATSHEEDTLKLWSALLGETIYFARDDAAKEWLIAGGAPPGSVYTRAELAVLVRAKISATELRRFHAYKQIFNGEWKGCDAP